MGNLLSLNDLINRSLNRPSIEMKKWQIQLVPSLKVVTDYSQYAVIRNHTCKEQCCI